jgi:general secretion pathway protein E
VGARDDGGFDAAVVVSKDGDRFPVSAASRDKMCLLATDELLVATHYKADMEVLSYQELLRRGGVKFHVKLVSVDVIQRLYAGAKGETTSSNTHRQNEVVGLIQRAVSMRASDIHFRGYEKHAEVWFRVDGYLTKFTTWKAEDGKEVCATMYGSMCDVAEETYKDRKSQDGRLKREFLQACGLYGARIATRPMEYGNLVVLRLLYQQGARPTLSDLGYLVEQVALISRMTRRTTGINIFSGPTGSGKSTSLEALLSQLLKEFEYKIHLLTLEDPTEYVIDGAVQTPIICDKDDPAEVSRGWTKAISNAMRLDPDVIMIGEMRDRDSAVTAFRAAMTGHGVWTTLHANNAMQILDRLRDVGVDLSFITDAALVTGLINQSLAPVSCPKCRRPYVRYKKEVPDDVQERIERFCRPEAVYLRGNDIGCPECNGRGFKGRQVVAECIVPNQRLMNEYRNSGASAARSFWVKELGGITKCAHLARLVNAGVVDPMLGEQKVCTLDEDELTLV